MKKTEQRILPAQLVESIYFFLDLGVCDKALAAALLALLLYRLSRRTADAILATRLLVCLLFLVNYFTS